MKYDHTVKHNGKVYPTGTEVPIGNDREEQEELQAVATPKEKVETKGSPRKK